MSINVLALRIRNSLSRPRTTQTQAGFSLMEVLLSLGISGITMLVVAQMFTNQYKSIAYIQNKASAMDLKNRLQTMTLDPQMCQCMLRGIGLLPAVGSVASLNNIASYANNSTPLDPVNPVACVDSQVIAVNGNVDQAGGLRVETIELVSQGPTATPGKFAADLQVSFIASNGPAIRPVNIPIIADVAGGNVATCNGVGASLAEMCTAIGGVYNASLTPPCERAPAPPVCPIGSSLNWDGTTWSCNQLAAAPPLPPACTSTQTLTWNGSGWTCTDIAFPPPPAPPTPNSPTAQQNIYSSSGKSCQGSCMVSNGNGMVNCSGTTTVPPGVITNSPTSTIVGVCSACNNGGCSCNYTCSITNDLIGTLTPP